MAGWRSRRKCSVNNAADLVQASREGSDLRSGRWVLGKRAGLFADAKGLSGISLNHGQTLALCFVVLRSGKPVPTFPEAL
jgi:hypothetical protein